MKTAEELIKEGDPDFEIDSARRSVGKLYGDGCFGDWCLDNWPDIRAHLLDLQTMGYEMQRLETRYDAVIKDLLAIHALLPPEDIQTGDGRTLRFHYPENLPADEVLRALAKEIKAIPERLRDAAEEPVRTVSAQTRQMIDAQSGGYELEAAEISKKSWQGR